MSLTMCELPASRYHSPERLLNFTALYNSTIDLLFYSQYLSEKIPFSLNTIFDVLFHNAEKTAGYYKMFSKKRAQSVWNKQLLLNKKYLDTYFWLQGVPMEAMSSEGEQMLNGTKAILLRFCDKRFGTS